MGEYFQSFADAWAAFLTRTEPLESFYDEFTGGAFDGEVWVIAPTPEVKRAALRVQGELERFDFLELVPHHFLHVSVPHAAAGKVAENFLIEGRLARVCAGDGHGGAVGLKEEVGALAHLREVDPEHFVGDDPDVVRNAAMAHAGG